VPRPTALDSDIDEAVQESSKHERQVMVKGLFKVEEYPNYPINFLDLSDVRVCNNLRY
jgi:hypothetical protein